MSQSETTLALRAILHDEISSGLKAIQKEITQVGNKSLSVKGSVEGMGLSLSGLGGHLQKLTGGLQSAAGALPGMGAALGGVSTAASALINPMTVLPGIMAGAAAGVIAATLSVAAGTEKLHNMSAATGLTTNQLRGLKSVSASVGVDFDTTAQAVSRMERSLGTNAEMAKKYGISTKDPMTALSQVSDLFVGIKDPMQRASTMTELLGRNWTSMTPVLAKGGAAIKETIASVTPMDPAAEQSYLKLQNTVHAVGMAFTSLKNSLASAGAADAIKDILQKLIQIMSSLKDNAQAVSMEFTALAKAFSFVINIVRSGMVIVGALEDVVIGAMANVADSILGIVSTVISAGTSIDNVFGRFLPASMQSGLKSGLASAKVAVNDTRDYLKTLQGNMAEDASQTAKKIADVWKSHKDVVGAGDAGGGGKQPPPVKVDNSAALAAEAELQKKLNGIKLQYAEKNADDERTALEIKESQRYDDELREFQATVKKRGKLSTAEQSEVDAALRIMAQTHTDAMNQIEEQGAAKAEKEWEDADEKKYKRRQELRDQDAKAEAEAQDERMRKAKENFDIEQTEWDIQQDALKERKAAYEQYSNKVQSLAQGQLESALKGELTLKSAKAAVKDAAIQFIAEETTKRIASYVESLAFGEATQATSSAAAVANAAVTGPAIAAAYAPAAATTSTATFGGSAVAGGVAIAALLAAIMAFSAAENGTDFAPGGMTLVGEKGPELVNLPRGSEVIPNHALSKWTGSNSGSNSTSVTHNTYVIKETVDARQLSKAISRAKSYQEVSRGRGSI